MLNFRDYLNYADKHLLLAAEESDKSRNVKWLLIPATILTWTAIESFVNNMLDDFSNLPPGIFELHERALLLEQKIKLLDKGDNIGQFVIQGTEYRRLEDKIFFLIAKFSVAENKNIKGNSLWSEFVELKDIRDRLIHPRRDTEVELSIDQGYSFIKTAKSIIQLISEHVWHKAVVF